MSVKVTTAEEVLEYEHGTYWTIDHNEHLVIRSESGKTLGTVHRNVWLSVSSSEDDK